MIPSQWNGGDLQKRKQRFASSAFYCELPKFWSFFSYLQALCSVQTILFSFDFVIHFVRWTRFEGSCIAFQCSLILHAYSYWKRNMNWPIKCGLGCSTSAYRYLDSDLIVTALSILHCVRPIRLHRRRMVFLVYLYDKLLLAHSGYV